MRGLLLPSQGRRSLIALRLVSGTETLAAIELSARIAGPISLDNPGLVEVPFENGRVAQVSFR